MLRATWIFSPLWYPTYLQNRLVVFCVPCVNKFLHVMSYVEFFRQTLHEYLISPRHECKNLVSTFFKRPDKRIQINWPETELVIGGIPWRVVQKLWKVSCRAEVLNDLVSQTVGVRQMWSKHRWEKCWTVQQGKLWLNIFTDSSGVPQDKSQYNQKLLWLYMQRIIDSVIWS
jgi:hypothetical protein